MQQKYQYQGISLYKYCDQHNINKFTIYSRIKKFRKENPTLTDDELVILALTHDLSKENADYLWNNTTLYKYCKTHPEISYVNIRSWLTSQLKLNPKSSIDELITNYITGKNNKNRWFYLGIPLKTFCINNNISYDSIRAYLFKALRNPKYMTWNDEELVSYLVERRFLINGKTLKEYCISINFPYNIVHELLQQELTKNPHNFKTILITTISTINNYRLTHYQTLKEFNNNITTYLNNSTNTYLKNNVNKLTLTR